MPPPRFQNCYCGHLGQQHHDDGRCGRCDCRKFSHPVSRSFPLVTGFLQGKPQRARARNRSLRDE